LKDSLGANEVLYHIDFSENYSTKYEEEVQSVHFGASRKQVSIHTGVMYFKKDGELTYQSFASVADNLDHSAMGVTSHMIPIYEHTKTLVPNVTVVHFISDGPSSQYKNKNNLNLSRETLKRIFGKSLRAFGWNFSVSGHGKGAADGVGAWGC